MRWFIAILLSCGSLHAFAQLPALMPSEATVRRFEPLVQQASHIHGVDEALVNAVIFAESSYDPRAVSSQGAAGLMQLMPETARRYGVRDVFDPAQNIQAGVRFLKELLVLFAGDVELAIAAYNAGADAVIRAGHRIPANPETLAFVPRVVRYYDFFRASRAPGPHPEEHMASAAPA